MGQLASTVAEELSEVSVWHSTQVTDPPEVEVEEDAPVIDLMEALRQSVKDAKKRRTQAEKPAAKEKPASKRAPARKKVAAKKR